MSKGAHRVVQWMVVGTFVVLGACSDGTSTSSGSGTERSGASAPEAAGPDTPSPEPATLERVTVELENAMLEPPAASGSLAPSISRGPSGVLMVWIEALEDEAGGHRLMFSRLVDDAWQPAVEIVRGDRFFANWADTPTIVETARGDLYAHWLEKLGEGAYSYGIQLARSVDGGTSWSTLGWLHDDLSETEHGFASMVPEGDGVRAIWLDGREMASGGTMRLRSAKIVGDVVRDRTVVAESVCECCATALAPIAGATGTAGFVAAFRSRSALEVRDISVSWQDANGWSAPRRAHADDWTIPGCPVNGPAIATGWPGPGLDAPGDGATPVALAWFTAAEGEARVKIAMAPSMGADFGTPFVIDDASPIGRVGATRADGDGDDAWVIWVASSKSVLGAEIRLQRFGHDGPRGPARVVTPTSASRAAGVPRIIHDGERLIVVWLEATPGAPSRLRTAALPAV